MEDNKESDMDLQRPPFFKSWKGMYLFVLGNLAVLVLLFLWFSYSFK